MPIPRLLSNIEISGTHLFRVMLADSLIRNYAFLALLSPLLASCNANAIASRIPRPFWSSAHAHVSPVTSAPTLLRSDLYAPLRIAPAERISQEIHNLAPRLIDPSGRDPRSTPGLIIGIVSQHGQQVFSFGTTEIGVNKKPTSSTLFPIGSLTKLFTGLVLAQLTTEDRLSLDDPAAKYLPDSLPMPDSSITLRQLVTNSSGLPNYPANLNAFRDLDSDGLTDYDQFNPGRNYSQQLLSDWLAALPRLDFPPGLRSQYSNLGFGILGILLEKHLGYSSYTSLIQAKVSRPLGLASTTATDNYDSLSDLATGYNFSDGFPREVSLPDMGALAGAGELISNVDDLLLFLRGLTGLSQSPLSAAFRELNRPISTIGQHTFGYGMKINQSKRGGSFALKTASTSGFSGVLAWRTRPRLGIVILANRGNFPRIYQLARHILENAVRN